MCGVGSLSLVFTQDDFLVVIHDLYIVDTFGFFEIRVSVRLSGNKRVS